MALTVANALAEVYRLEAEEQARKKQIKKTLDSLEDYAKSVDNNTVEKFAKYGIDIRPLISVDFRILEDDIDAQREYIDVVNHTVAKTVEFVEEYMNNVRCK